MFWKKKPAEDFGIELPEADDSAVERRASFRISTANDPISVRIEDREYRALNISAGGLAVKAKDLRTGVRYSIRLQLPDGSPAIHTELEVVSITQRGVCRCRFLQLSVLSSNAIQRYILGREKERIRTTRMGRALPPADD